MKLYWNDNELDAEIGHYELFFVNDDGNTIAKMYLKDYTCEFYKEKGRPRHYENVNFEYSYCDGFSIHKCIEEEITLEQAKKQAENWLIEYFISTFENTKKSLINMEKRAKWLSEYRADRDN